MKSWFVYTAEFYFAAKKNGDVMFAWKWRDLESAVLKGDPDSDNGSSNGGNFSVNFPFLCFTCLYWQSWHNGLTVNGYLGIVVLESFCLDKHCK